MRTFVHTPRLCSIILFQLLSVCFFLVGNALAVDVTLAWDPTAASDLAGYKVYYRTCSAGVGCTEIGVVDNLSGVTIRLSELADRDAPQYTLKGLPSESDFVFVLTAYTSSGVESGFSNEAFYRAPVADSSSRDEASDEEPPGAPVQLDGATNSSTNGDSVVLTWGESSDNVGVSIYIIYRNGTEIGTTANTQFTDADVLAGSTYVYTVAAVDTAGNQSDASAALSVTVPSDEASGDSSGGGSESAVVRVNCGGSDYLDTDGNEWAADSGYIDGLVAMKSVPIADTADDTLFQSKRRPLDASPQLEYRFDIANGSYRVRLLFAEIYTGAFREGYRQFDIQIEDSIVEDNLDIYAEAGANTALAKNYLVTINDGRLDIQFLRVASNPIISAIEVVPATNGAEDTSPQPPSSDSEFSFEAGEVSVDNAWVRVNFQNRYSEPIVVARSLSKNGKNQAVIRIRNINASGFDISVQEWNYLDGWHCREELGYLVVERGAHTFQDGTKFEASVFTTDRTTSFEHVLFEQSYNQTPVVITSVASVHESDAVTGRMQSINTEGFMYRLQEEEANAQTHRSESIAYIAWEPSIGEIDGVSYQVSRTKDIVKQQFYSIRYSQEFTAAPFLLADMQTTDGGDTANIRWQQKNSSSVQVQVCEEQSRDDEMNHTSEVVGFMLFSQ